MEFLKLKIDRRVALVTIDRPTEMNSINRQTLEELSTCFEVLEVDDTVGAVIITAEGPKAFGAGADIGELAGLSPIGAKELSLFGQAVFRKIEEFPKPVIAAVNGIALGGSCELALCCHLRLAAKNAKFGLPEVGLGIMPGYGGSQRLSRLVGKGLALELMMTGEMISAERAHAIGLVNHISDPANLIRKCKKIAGKILSRAPLSVSSVLEAVNRGLQVSQQEGERIEADLFGFLAGTADAREGFQAYAERKQPHFKGR